MRKRNATVYGRKRLIVLLMTLLAALLMLPAAPASLAEEAIDLTSVEGIARYFDGKSVGVLTGSVYDKYLEQHISGAASVYFNSQADMALALGDGKIDGMITDEPIARMMCVKNDALYQLPVLLKQDDYGMILNKNSEALRDQLSQTILRMKQDGSISRLEAKWFAADEAMWTAPDMNALTGENGTLKVAVDASMQPFILIKNQRVMGLDVDILYEMAKEFGYRLEFINMDFAACLSSVITGKADVGAACVFITEERKEKVLFAESQYSSGYVMVVAKTSIGVETAASALDTPEGLREYLSGKTVGVLSGSNQDAIAQECLPGCKLMYLPDPSMLSLSLREGKISAYLEDKPVAQMLCAESDLYRISKATLKAEQYGFVFRKGRSALKQQMDALLAKLKASGEMDALAEKWLSADESLWTIDAGELTGENGTLCVAGTMSSPPFETYHNGQPAGYAVELLTLFAKEYGYRLEYDAMDFSAILPSIVSQKSDIGSCSIAITPERMEQVLFSEPIFDGGIVVVLPATAFGGAAVEAKAEGGLLQTIASSFERTFIRESRWRLILQGLWMTILISVCSALLGTLLGGVVCVMRRSPRALPRGVAAGFIKLLQGTPIVVLLMILYYVVFGDVNAVLVAVVGFSVNFAAYTAEMMRTGLDAVDKGQLEAATALGYNKRQAYTRIIIPQATRYVLPVYRGELISLVKSTSVVGYIAIQDLTKMSDIIRSRTYEAFFPLIATAVIYFLLAWGLVALLTLVENKTDPKRRKREIKGVTDPKSARMEA